ncbi:YcaQ family DNA glycosylase [candidate division WOR-3 bacterium]|nr:YcaQ family DNA glycosylase [candidate division WOR-3 bacterium]
MARKYQEAKLSKESARDFLLSRQLLTGARLPKGKAGTLRAIEHLGYVQIDTISVVERSHHLVLRTRLPDYEGQHLHDLQAEDRKIFEYWAHAASYVPMKDYRFYIPAMKREPKEGSWFDQWAKKNADAIKMVGRRIKKEGPLAPSDFEDDRKRKRGPWWDWKPAKAALEVLFWRGELMVKERRNFQRVYDLTERVLPDGLDTTMPTEHEEKEFFVRRALHALGIATIRDMDRYIGISGKLAEAVSRMHAAGEIADLEIDGLKRPYYALTKDFTKISSRESQIDDHVRFLSPFDNSIILRDRTQALFDFDYCLECYVPKPKRKYGYFCLPILWRNQLVGRIDPKADRTRRVLLVQNLHLDSNLEDENAFFEALAAATNNFARFNSCERVEINSAVPSRIKRKISSRLL